MENKSQSGIFLYKNVFNKIKAYHRYLRIKISKIKNLLDHFDRMESSFYFFHKSSLYSAIKFNKGDKDLDGKLAYNYGDSFKDAGIYLHKNGVVQIYLLLALELIHKNSNMKAASHCNNNSILGKSTWIPKIKIMLIENDFCLCYCS